MSMRLTNKQIFIVEDSPTNIAVISLILQREGAVVRYEQWGRETVQRLMNFKPVDLILLDLMFPNNITGYDVFDHIRQVPDFVDIPVVAVTAADMDRELPKVRQKGFNGYIRKPIRTKTFPAQIEAVLRGEEVWDY